MKKLKGTKSFPIKNVTYSLHFPMFSPLNELSLESFNYVIRNLKTWVIKNKADGTISEIIIRPNEIEIKYL